MTRDVSRPSERSGAEHSRPIYRFKDCEIDPAAYRLLVRGDPVSIEPRVFELLVYLILNRERVVTKDELLNALWAGKYVSESTLTRAIHAARRATGDDSQRQEIIKTLHSRGYQFVAAVAKVEPDRAEAPDAVEPSTEHAPRSVTKGRLRSALHRHRRVLWGAVLSLAMLSVALFFVFSNRHLQPQRERLALAPFSVDPAAEDLGWGELALPGLVADELRDRAGVAVFSANRVRQALHQKGLDADSHPQEQVRVLRDVFGVDHVLFAHVGRDNAWLRIDYALVSADGRRFASTARAQGAGSLVSELASSIARQLDVAYNARIPSRKIGSDEFINESFARGLQALLAGRLEDAMRYFEACLAGDPDNGWAKYKLGNVLRLQGRWDEAEQLYYAAHEHGEQNGDPDLGAAASAGMGLLAWLQGRMDEAERHFESARERWATIGRRASLASVHGNLGVLADNRHDYSGAREQYERALTLYRSEGERAGKSAVYSNLAVIERKLGNMETAAELQQRAIDLQRQLGLDRMLVLSLAHLGEIERERGRWEAAEQAFAESLRVAELAADRIGLADARFWQAALASDLARADDALTWFREAYSIYKELDSPANLARTSLRMAEVLRHSDPDEARASAREALMHAQALDDEALKLESELVLADLDGADSSPLLPRLRALGDHRLLAIFWAQRARHEGEPEHLSTALAFAERSGAKRLQAELAVELAQMMLRRGASASDIEPLLDRAEAWRPDHPPVLLLRSCYFAQLQRRQSAQALWEQARTVLPTPPAMDWCPGWADRPSA